MKMGADGAGVWLGNRKGDVEPRNSLEGGIHGLASSEQGPRCCLDGLILEGSGCISVEAGRGF